MIINPTHIITTVTYRLAVVVGSRVHRMSAKQNDAEIMFYFWQRRYPLWSKTKLEVLSLSSGSKFILNSTLFQTYGHTSGDIFPTTIPLTMGFPTL